MGLSRRTLASDTATSTGATSVSISPTGMQAGDWLIIGVISSGGGGSHTNTAGGLTRVHADQNTGSTITTSTWKKKCAAGEAGPYTIDVAATRRWAIVALCYSGGDQTDIVEAAPTQTTTSGTSLAVTGVDPAGTGGIHLIFEFSRIVAGSTQTFGPPAGYTELFEFQSSHATNVNAALAVSVKALPDNSATGDQTFTVTTSDRINGASVLLKYAGQSAAIGIATETDTAVALGRAKTYTIGTAAETDTALQILPGGIRGTATAGTRTAAAAKAGTRAAAYTTVGTRTAPTMRGGA